MTGCIVGEPTGLDVVVGHKGKQNHRITFTGEPRHAALAPQLPNPIVAAAALAGHAGSRNEEFRTEGPHDDRFDIGHSWINIGRIDGGVKAQHRPRELRRGPGDQEHPRARLRRHRRGPARLRDRRAARRHAGPVGRRGGHRRAAVRHPVLRDRAGPCVRHLRPRGPSAPRRTPATSRSARRRGSSADTRASPPSSAVPASSPRRTTADEFVALDQSRGCLDRLTSLLLGRRQDAGAGTRSAGAGHRFN
ncbi:peptidase dimerization domain-containing protein [Streptomyces tricolor]|nr:peptidase dimerization domain-containing protein [Streptomyces tricolor]